MARGPVLSIDERPTTRPSAEPRVRAVIRCERTNPIIPQGENGRRLLSHTKQSQNSQINPVPLVPIERLANIYRLRPLSSTACCNTDDTIRLETDKLGRYTAFYTALEDGQRSYYNYVQRTMRRRRSAVLIFAVAPASNDQRIAVHIIVYVDHEFHELT